MVKLSVVIPVYNAAANLAELHRRLTLVLREQGQAYEIIMVDDGSRDKSLEMLFHLQKHDPQLKVVGLAKNYGQQHAVVRGLLETEGQYIIIMDDDLQHPPEEIPRLLGKLAEGYDLVFGVPVEKRHAWYRKLGTSLTDAVFTLAGLKERHTKISSFRAVLQEVVRKAFRGWTEGFIYVSAELLPAAQRVTWLKVTHNPRRSGRTNYNLRKLLKLWGKLIFYYYLWPGRQNRSSSVVKTTASNSGVKST